MKKHRKAIALASYIAGVLHGNAKEIYGEESGKRFEIRSWAGGNCRGVDIGNYRFVTQNPTKTSEFARMARAGHQVTWVIHSPTNAWVARVVDGKTEPLSVGV